MSTIRVAKRQRFTVIDRRPINDERLSFRARGVLVWLLDKPDDWATDRDSIARAGIEGQHAIRGVLQELRDTGYLVRHNVRQKDGTITAETVLYECPQEPQPLVENRPAVNRPADSRPPKEVLRPNTDKRFASQKNQKPEPISPQFPESTPDYQAQIEAIADLPPIDAKAGSLAEMKKQLGPKRSNPRPSKDDPGLKQAREELRQLAERRKQSTP